MNVWRDATDELAGDDAERWSTWLQATYEIYRQTASHFEVERSPWWQEVRALASAEDTPADVQLAVELLDAMSAKDGPRLQKAVDACIDREDFPLPDTIRTIAGMLALEIVGADAATRHAFVERYMNPIGNGTGSEDYAYQVLRAYAARP